MSGTQYGKMFSIGGKTGFLTNSQIDVDKFQETLKRNMEISEQRSRIEKYKMFSDRGIVKNHDSIYISANSGDEDETGVAAGIGSKRDSIMERSPGLS